MFKSQYSFEDRFAESSHSLEKYPDRIPIICEKVNGKNDLSDIYKNKYLVPFDLTMSNLYGWLVICYNL